MRAERKERETEAIRIMVRKTQDIMPDMIRMAWEATFSLCSNFNTHKHAQLRHIFIITACNGGLSDSITPWHANRSLIREMRAILVRN